MPVLYKPFQSILEDKNKKKLYDKWRRFIIEHKLDFINVIDGVHINNLTERFDINRTPVIYILDKKNIIKLYNFTQFKTQA
jgi:hypothetical protein